MAVIATLLLSVVLVVSWLGSVMHMDAQRFEYRRMSRSYGLAVDREQFEEREGPLEWVVETHWDGPGYSVRWPRCSGGGLRLLNVAAGENGLVYVDRETGEGWSYDESGNRKVPEEEQLEALHDEALDRIRTVTGVNAQQARGRALVLGRWCREKGAESQWILVKKNP